MANLSPEAQEAAATVYVQKGKTLDQIEKTYPQLAAGVKRLRAAEKKSAARTRGSGPSDPIISKRPKF